MVLQKKKYSFIDLVGLTLRVSPALAIICMVEKLVSSLLPTIKVLVVADFLNEVTKCVKDQSSLQTIFPTLILIAIMEAYHWLVPKLMEKVDCKLECAFREKFRMEIIQKTARLKYCYIENQDTQNLIKRITQDCELQGKTQFNNTLQLVGLIFEIIGLIGIIATKVWWVAILIFLISIPLFKISLNSGDENYQAKRDVSTVERRNLYYMYMLQNRDCVDERNVFGYSDKVTKNYYEDYEDARKYKALVQLKWFVKMKLSGCMTAVFSTIVSIVLVPATIAGTISIGLYISIIDAVFSLVQVLSWGLTSCLDKFAEDMQYMKELTKFMQLEETENAVTLPDKSMEVFESLEFKDVSFCYPGTKADILKHMSFKIEKGKHYSFVGENGSGKTTITKLIIGLYDNYEGDIVYNGISYRNISSEQKKALASVVFQDFARYPVSVRDNIAIGDMCNFEQVQVDLAIQTMDLSRFIDKLPNGIQSNLGKMKNDSVDISGGEWQKIALARSIVNENAIKILDEPTAALDPISENLIYEQFEKISHNRTTIFISHRLGSTKLADTIFVIGDGSIKERGTHKQLMERNGIYRNMYDSQKKWYEESEKDGEE